jgi:hypothetical protein
MRNNVIDLRDFAEAGTAADHAVAASSASQFGPASSNRTPSRSGS